MVDTVEPGSIAVHGNAKIRGTIGGSTGTFSGRFSADTIGAIDNINIRDGAVSTYYIFDKVPTVNYGFEKSFVMPAQRWDSLLFIFCSISIGAYPTSNIGIRVYKNGTEIASGMNFSFYAGAIIPTTLCVQDILAANQSATYKLSTYRPNYGLSSMLSPVIVEIRKR